MSAQSSSAPRPTSWWLSSVPALEGSAASVASGSVWTAVAEGAGAPGDAVTGRAATGAPDAAAERLASRRSVVELLHTADVLRRRFLLALAPHRVSLPQYNVLRILRGAGGGPLASSVIADRMIEQALGVSSLLERMEAIGWIARDRAAPSGLVAYGLTPAGAGVLARVDPVLDAECAAVMAVLSCATRDALAEALRQLREAGG